MRVRRRWLVPVSLVVLFMLGQVAYAGTTLVEVKATNRIEFLGSGNTNFFGWTQDRVGHPRARDAWYEPMPVGSGTPVRLNASGDKAYAGTIDQTSDQMGWQRVHNGNSDVRVYDLAGQANVTLPNGINTSKWEWAPSVSGGRMTFARDGRNGQSAILVDLATGVKTTFLTTDYAHSFLGIPPRIAGNWIVYFLATTRGWKAYEYDITNGTTQKIPNPNDKLYYAPSVDLSGNVYFIRSGNGCAASVRLMEWTPGSDPVVLFAFDSTHDVNDTSTFDDGAGTITVYIGTYDCSTGESDIDSLTNPTAAPVRASTQESGREGVGAKPIGMFGGGAS